jgi:hypothetical protein
MNELEIKDRWNAVQLSFLRLVSWEICPGPDNLLLPSCEEAAKGERVI